MADQRAPHTDDQIPVRRERLAYRREQSAVVRDAAIAILILVCLAQPQIVRSWLSSLGVSKATIFGLELTPANEDKIASTISQLEQARDGAIAERNEFARKAAQALAELKRVQGGNPTLDSSLAQVRTTLREAAQQPQGGTPIQQSIVQGARETLKGDARWAVVFGGDLSLAEAQDELAWAQRNGIDDTAVMLRRGWYRSVAPQPSLEAAEQALRIARQRRRDAYIVNLATWCPRLTDRAGFKECRS